KERQWNELWDSLAMQSRLRRLLRRVELHVWMGVFSLFELFALVLRLIFEVVGLSDLPSGAFWMQVLARRVHRLWFGDRRDFVMAPRKNARGEKILFPRVLSSLLL